MIRETGWTVSQYRQESMGDVFDLVANINENPPAHLILAARYGVKPGKSRSRAANPAPEPLKSGDVSEMARAMGVKPQPMPADVRSQFEWAQQEMARRAKRAKKK